MGPASPKDFSVPAPRWGQNHGLIIYANEGAEAWLIPNSAKCKSHLQFGPRRHYVLYFLLFSRQLLNYVFLRLM